ncbi:AAA family ATPase [Paenibacillus sp. LHD-117]|uniref:AAA family ATPase n=1 Tax=Paenibacillus sp. LHD-117 TaxID=3071412 RepID=UPI0027E19D58|nr:AAA family ATPase [Paenibacillus sp. LHD-117]MDQ6421755.1 AAA family ATPase [Paenibacillus sp. LHD-117]
MILWINGAFGSGKTTTANELHRRIPHSFIYDPENIGYFIRKNAPKSMQKDDFQDHELWRSFNYSMLLSIAKDYSGTVIVPMTIVDEQYFDEIVTRLRTEGVEVKHYTLAASRDTLLKRLKRRGDGSGSWPAKQIDRCIASLSKETFAKQIETDQLTIDDTLEIISADANIPLRPDHRGIVKKKLDRLATTIKHIRF